MVTSRDVVHYIGKRNAKRVDVDDSQDQGGVGEPAARRPMSDREGSHERWYVSSGPDQRDRFKLVDGLPPFRLLEYCDSYGESVLRLCEDSTGLLIAPKNRYLPNVGVYVSQVRGEKYYADGCRAGNFAPGVPVSLVREPDNTYDKNAVAVFDEAGLHRGGYIDKTRARKLARLIDAEEPLSAISLRGTFTGQSCPQIAILITSPKFMQHLFSVRPASAPTPVYLRTKTR